jgi:tetratricopeptide (TPR) repeat protein
MWSTLLGSGRSREAATHCQEGLALYDRGERRPWWLYGTHDPGVCCRHILSVAAWLLGRPDDALRWLREGLSLAGELGHPFTTMIALHNATFVHYHRGDAERAVETANAAIALGRDQGYSVWPERVAAILGRVLVEQGRIADGLAQGEEAIGRVAALGSTCWQDDLSRALLAGAYGIAARPDEGLALVEPLAARPGPGFYQPEIHRIRGELWLARSPAASAEAERCFRDALALARDRQERSLELRAATSLARLLRRTDRLHEGRPLLAAALAGFTDGFETTDLREARVLLDELA